MTDRLIIFLKRPEPGRVKTRLAASIGSDAACRVYVELVDGLLSRFETLPGVELRVAPDDAVNSQTDWLRPGWFLSPQGSGGLGERLMRGFQTAFADGAKRVLAIGSDCPYVEIRHVRNALASLASSDVVIGPALDGGYWLIGMKRFRPEIFSGIDWSTEHVRSQTENQARKSGATVALLEPLEDVDDIESWERYKKIKSNH